MTERIVAVTGMGIASCIGNDLATVEASLRNLTSGIAVLPDSVERRYRSKVGGIPPALHPRDNSIDRKLARSLSQGARWNLLAAIDAVKQAGLTSELLHNPRCGGIMATGTAPTLKIHELGLAVEKARQAFLDDPAKIKGASDFPGVAFAVAQTMGSTNSANAAVFFGLQGPTWTVSSACASSGISVVNAADLIKLGRADIMLAGGGDPNDWVENAMFDGMGALAPTEDGENPATVSRTFDKDRKGFVIAGGGGCLVLEELEHAQARGAKILAILAGYGCTTDGGDSMTNPTVEGPARCMRDALEMAGKDAQDVAYLNAHGTSTPVGDLNEMKAVQEIFGDDWWGWVSSTKPLTGHSLGSAGVQEAIYTLLAMGGEFVPGSANIVTLDPEIAALPVSARIVRETQYQDIEIAMSNSFGFGGTNCTLLFETARRLR